MVSTSTNLAKSDVLPPREHKTLVSDTLKELDVDHKMEVSPFENSNVTFTPSPC